MDSVEEILKHWFSFHPPADNNVAHTHDWVREKCGDLAIQLNDAVPPGVEKMNMFDKLREVMFWANAGVACNQPRGGNGES